MDTLNESQKYLIAPIIATPSIFAPPDTPHGGRRESFQHLSIRSLVEAIEPTSLPDDQRLQKPEEQDVDSKLQSLEAFEWSDGAQTSSDRGKFKTSQIDFLLAAFSPLFDDTKKNRLRCNHLDPADYAEIGTHLVQAFGDMLIDKKSHHMQVLEGLFHAIIDAVDEGILQKGTNPNNLDELMAMAKLLATKATSSPSIQQQLWKPPPHLDPMLIRGITDTAKRTQLYQDLNSLAMGRITPLLTERSLAFANRANVRPVPLSKNERSFFFQLMTVFPVHGTERELNERIALWIAAVPSALKRTRPLGGAGSILANVHPSSKRSKNDAVVASPEKEPVNTELACFDKLTLISLRTLVKSIGNITGSAKQLPWIAISSMAPCDTLAVNDPATKSVETLLIAIARLGLNEDMKDTSAIWKTWAEFMFILGVAKPWPSMIKRQLTWFCTILVLKQTGRSVLVGR